MKTYILETKYEFLKALRTPAFSVPTILFPILFYSMFGIVFGWKETGNVRMAEYLLATYGAFGVIGASLFGFGVTVAVERGHGWMEAKRTTPMPIAAYFVAKMAVAMLFSAIIVLLLFALATSFGGVTLTFFKGLTLFLTLIAGSVTFCAVGLAIGFLASPSGAAPIVNVIYLPMGFLSGLWIPIQFLPYSVQDVAQFLPPYHYSQLALKVIGASRGESVVFHLGAMAIAAALFSTIAYAGYRRDTAQVH
ncbi:MAG TPA: ABC transporter permease [Thermoanaerobaculia bacterium]|jgi:ABC-2 type transport system permease protein